MLSGVIFRARHVMIAMGLMAAFLCNASASPNTVTVQSGGRSPKRYKSSKSDMDGKLPTRILHMFIWRYYRCYPD